MASPQTICWSCQNATRKGCEWASEFMPVDGWEAEESFKKGAGKTYIVHTCPKFIRDSWHYGQYRTKAEYMKYLATKEKNKRKKEEQKRRKLEEAKKLVKANGIKIIEKENENE